jgi:hypothetical protein
MSVSTTSCRVTLPLNAAYDGEYYTPTFRLAMWHAIADTRGSGREKKRLVIRPLL